ncbi:ArsR family transcriptional regulator [Lonsdalea populi]|uniref:Transcriptional regulator n=1 Tax=Lonsdalea populi TaxID=1172565 RepID=A0A3N0UJQ5_9GAMM|nr:MULTISPECIES: helix-turn-helix domain-containing protein [Lonsdalea]RAT18058.1 ArsR family transcriptional regulator [Lonsdalea quercina]RAT29595.1 ArsR family transcriptional regulator [Lonsdalea populi]RAT39545.1 ArsR family transcriptional regulator [Lonsdalea populi]RAT48328.1 ArsR family transcriptional regulator [Lonsdalea populi]RAT54598.1 ArsR family transcriptional regulator [Lonsdalea populi]
MSTVNKTKSVASGGEPANLPEPLPEPDIADLRLETILSALADPLRLTIVRKLMLEAQAYDHPCGWFGFDRPKSSLTHHFKALREAGVIRQRQYGLERRSRLRSEDLEARFPGLLALVANWLPSPGKKPR